MPNYILFCPQYDSDDAESLFEKIRGSITAAVVTTN